MRQRRSLVWKCFKLQDGYAECMLCNAVVNKMDTSNMKRHLGNFHSSKITKCEKFSARGSINLKRSCGNKDVKSHEGVEEYCEEGLCEGEGVMDDDDGYDADDEEEIVVDGEECVEEDGKEFEECVDFFKNLIKMSSKQRFGYISRLNSSEASWISNLFKQLMDGDTAGNKNIAIIDPCEGYVSPKTVLLVERFE